MKRSWLTPWRARRLESGEILCRQAVELVTAYLDDALEPAAREALERHLATCSHCDEYFAQIRLVRQTAAKVEPEDLAPEARADLAALFLSWRDDAE